MALAAASVQATWLTSQDAAGTHRNFTEQVRRLQPAPNQLYVIWGGGIQLEQLVTPLGGFNSTSGLQAIQLGWPNRSPHIDRRLHEFGMSDLYVDLWKKPNAFLISSQSRCLGLVQFVAAHYGPIVTCTTRDATLSVRQVTLSTTQAAGPSINVRWKDSVTEAEREALVQKYGLGRPRPLDEHTWRYEVVTPEPALLLGLVTDRAVEDTAGIDRQSGAISNPAPDW